VNFTGYVMNILPAAAKAVVSVDNADEVKNYYVQHVPVSRQYIEVGGNTVGASEYTIWETMSPLAALAGMLMGPNFMPDSNWKLREPVRDRYALDGYIFLP